MYKRHLTAALLAAVLWRSAEARRAQKDWDNLDYDKLEAAWEQGDEEEELKTEGQLMFERLERRKEQVKKESLDMETLQRMRPDEVQRFVAGQKDAAGPTMLFVKLKEGMRKASLSEKQDAERVASIFREMALAGGLEVTPYYVQERTLLVSMQKGWEGQQALDFLLGRPEVEKVTWNNQDFHPLLEDEL